jgi:hypothetical protein
LTRSVPRNPSLPLCRYFPGKPRRNDVSGGASSGQLRLCCCPLAAVRTLNGCQLMSAIGGKADITQTRGNVR